MHEARSVPCADCQRDDLPPEILHFHHRDPSEKLFQIGGRHDANKSTGALKAEIAKCDVLCPTCHALRHYHARLEAALAVS
jgi:integrase